MTGESSSKAARLCLWVTWHTGATFIIAGQTLTRSTFFTSSSSIAVAPCSELEDWGSFCATWLPSCPTLEMAISATETVVLQSGNSFLQTFCPKLYKVTSQVGNYILLTLIWWFWCLPCSAWAAANLAELSRHVGYMVELQNQSKKKIVKKVKKSPSSVTL